MENFYINEKPFVPAKKRYVHYDEKLWLMRESGEISDKEYTQLKIKHDLRLEQKRKYKQGKPIHSFDELFEALKEDKLVWLFGKPMTYGFVASQQFNTIITQLNFGKICRVIKKS